MRTWKVPLVAIFLLACNKPESPVHYFLDGYPDLLFIDHLGNPVPASFFIHHQLRNGVNFYVVDDPSLMLVHRKDREPYDGYIRTYHWDIYNIEALFKDGRIRRIRYWHPNRQLGMDADFRTRSGQAWTADGKLAISWTAEEEYFMNPTLQSIRQIRNDTLTTYFNFEGKLEYFAVRTDTSYRQYYPDSTLRFLFPVSRFGERHGIVKRWHPNGQLQTTGEYRNGREFGTWIEYDSLGNEINRKTWPELE